MTKRQSGPVTEKISSDEIARKIGEQVQGAVDVLVRRWDRADAENGRKLLPPNSNELYEAGVTVMMRLLVVLFAEHRGLLPQGHPVYDRDFALEALRGTPQTERGYAWKRLLSLFRAIHGGFESKTLRIPAWKSALFDPDRFPFLEEPATEIDDNTVLVLLTALALDGEDAASSPGYRTLDIEVIGHVYESLLENTVKRLDEITLAFEAGRSAKSANIPLSALESAASEDGKNLVALIRHHTKKSESVLRKALAAPLSPLLETRLASVCAGRPGLFERIRPYGNLLRLDAGGDPVVGGEGSYAVTPGPRRRETGTHYTPKPLTAEIVETALEPLVYESFSNEKSSGARRLKGSGEILSLKICDPAMGSGAFLLQACRRLGDWLVEAREAEENGEKTGLPTLPAEPDRRLPAALRLVAEHCLYGVDINPSAVELAKLSIGLLTMSKEGPPETLERRFRHGDALLGLPFPERSDFVLPDVRRRPDADALVDAVLKAKGRGVELRKNFDTLANPARSLGSEPTDTAKRTSFHWPLEFPDVFSGEKGQGGFDVILGNPPFLGGRKMRGTFGEGYLHWLLFLWPHASLNADLCVFFFLRAAMLLKDGGSLCFLATDTIGQGDSARTGLLFLTEKAGFRIGRARSAFHWPGRATVVTALVALRKGEWPGKPFLDGRAVDRITAVLDEGDRWGDARTLKENVAINFQGSVLAGRGFVLTPEEAGAFASQRPANRRALFPFLGGNDLNTSPTLAASRRVIDFRDFPLEYCEREWPELLDRIRRLVKPLRDKAARAAHRRYWWQHGDKRPALYERIRKHEFVFALVRHSKHLALARISTGQVFQESLCLLDLPDWTAFAAIQSSIHDAWARRGSSTLGEGLRYTPSDYFDTFPFLHLKSPDMERLGEEYHARRREIMLAENEGLTAIYNRFHRPEESDAGIVRLRDLHRRMDEAVTAAYGWNDLNLDHGFHAVGPVSASRRARYTVGKAARREILRRLTELNAAHDPERPSEILSSCSGSGES